MKKDNEKPDADELLPEYDLTQLQGGVRGKYLARYRAGTNLALLAPNVRAAFPTDEAVNEAFRSAKGKFMKVYRVGVKTASYQYFFTDDPKFLDEGVARFHGEPIGDAWVAPDVFIYRPRAKEGHFLGFITGFVFAVAADTIRKYAGLSSFFEQGGELLPFEHNGRDYRIFNCTNCINAFDAKKADTGSSCDFINKYAFLPNRFNFSLFSIPEAREVLCVEGICDPLDEFKGYVEENKLTGLMFEELWSEAAV